MKETQLPTCYSHNPPAGRAGSGLGGSLQQVLLISFCISGIDLAQNWWASAIPETEGAWCMKIRFDEDTFSEWELHMKKGFSVRCVKD